VVGFFDPGTKVVVTFEGTIVSEGDGDTITVESDSGFRQRLNLDYPGVTVIKREEEE